MSGTDAPIRQHESTPAARTARQPRRRWPKYVGLVLAILLTEALLRAGFWLEVRSSLGPGFGLQPELLARLYYAHQDGHYSMLPIGSKVTEYDAHRGYRLAPGLRNAGVGGTTASTGSRGTRGIREYALPKPASVMRAVALGDSLTFGEGVSDESTWPAQLEQSVPGLEVANFGVGGYAHDQMYFALRDDGVQLQPDLVILGFFENDVWRDELTYYAYEKPRFSRRSTGWTIENVPVPTPEQVRNRYLLMPLTYALPRVLVERLVARTDTDSDEGRARAGEILRRMRQVADDAGARFVIVHLPDLLSPLPKRTDSSGTPPTTGGFFYEFCAQSGAECVDPWPEFWATASREGEEAMRARYLRPRDIHYARGGYAVVAEVLRRHLAEHPVAARGPDKRDPFPTTRGALP